MLEVKEHVPLAELTTFNIGGPAKYVIKVHSEDDIRVAISWAHDKKIPFVILGGGSNVLVPDAGIDKLVIWVSGGHFSFAHTEIAADAGCNLLEVIRAAAAHGLGGWESLSGIPGTIGGAVRGNAGAFGTEMRDVLHKVRAINTNTGAMRAFVNAECGFAYRNSFFKHHPKWIITRAYFELKRIQPTASDHLITETIAERERRHLQNVRAAGSFFMNPVAPREIQEMFEKEKNAKSREGRVPAGWLIEKVGMKGARVGGAIASQQHPNYLVNENSASAKNVLELAAQIKAKIRQEFEIELQEEAAIL